MIDSSGLPFGKPPSRAGARAEKRREHNAVVSETRALVFELDRVCAVCGGWPRASDEMHEVISRSQTRGMAPEDRFNRRICVRLHRECHHAVTEHRVELAFVDWDLGVDGGLIGQARGSQQGVVYRRGRTPSHVPAGPGVARRQHWNRST